VTVEMRCSAGLARRLGATPAAIVRHARFEQGLPFVPENCIAVVPTEMQAPTDMMVWPILPETAR
jgi:hypothetical protein